MYDQTVFFEESKDMNKYKVTIKLMSVMTLISVVTIALFLKYENSAHAKDKKSNVTPVQQITNENLPNLTLQMKEDLIDAASSGDLEEIRDLFESNELAPVLTNEHISDPLDYWKKVSVDGSARDIMAAIAEVFSLPPVKNKNGDFIWPYLAKVPLKKLTKQQQIDLFRLVGPKQATQMLETGVYTYYEAKIGKDGTWHYFKKLETTEKK